MQHYCHQPLFTNQLTDHSPTAALFSITRHGQCQELMHMKSIVGLRQARAFVGSANFTHGGMQENMSKALSYKIAPWLTNCPPFFMHSARPRGRYQLHNKNKNGQSEN